jgi:hypothetical protein
MAPAGRPKASDLWWPKPTTGQSRSQWKCRVDEVTYWSIRCRTNCRRANLHACSEHLTGCSAWDPTPCEDRAGRGCAQPHGHAVQQPPIPIADQYPPRIEEPELKLRWQAVARYLRSNQLSACCGYIWYFVRKLGMVVLLERCDTMLPFGSPEDEDCLLVRSASVSK